MPPASSTSKADVRAVLARVLLTREVGQRIPTVQDLQHTSRAGAGTVVKALRSLQDSGAVTLSSHGHQGTLVVSRNVGQLWREAQLGNFSLIMPPPGPVEQHGILEALQEPLARQGVPVVVSALAGARRRLERLHLESADAVVTSAGAFERHRDDFPGLRSLDLGESTFYSPGSLVVVEGPKPVRGAGCASASTGRRTTISCSPRPSSPTATSNSSTGGSCRPRPQSSGGEWTPRSGTRCRP
ncbi:hypothetical protein K1X59_17045 [Microbacterium sp. Se5.02b]|nr:hypothetical protein K1X59_17045 [Microbacterium sp. Se5.02b]